MQWTLSSWISQLFWSRKGKWAIIDSGKVETDTEERTLKTHSAEQVPSKEKLTTVNFLSDVRESLLKPLRDSRWLRIDQEISEICSDLPTKTKTKKSDAVVDQEVLSSAGVELCWWPSMLFLGFFSCMDHVSDTAKIQALLGTKRQRQERSGRDRAVGVRSNSSFSLVNTVAIQGSWGSGLGHVQA